jgi:hypothetical protein
VPEAEVTTINMDARDSLALLEEDLESERSTRSREELQADFPKISRLIG